MSMRKNEDYITNSNTRSSQRPHVSGEGSRKTSSNNTSTKEGYGGGGIEYGAREQEIADLRALKLDSHDDMLAGRMSDEALTPSGDVGSYSSGNTINNKESNNGYSPLVMESGVIEMPRIGRKPPPPLGFMGSTESFKYPKDLSDSQSEFGSQYYGNASSSTVDGPYPPHVEGEFESFEFGSNDNLSTLKPNNGYSSSTSDLAIPPIKYNDPRTSKNQEPTTPRSGTFPEISSVSTDSSLTNSRRSSSAMQPQVSNMHSVYNGQSGMTNSNEMFTARSTAQKAQYSHRTSNSISSLWSVSSNRQVNLGSLKKGLNLKPGEGQRSDYISTVRKHLGTAYNETPPGKWKLPTGIMPIDRTVSSGIAGKYMRLTGGVSLGRSKKGTGVELKHGHLKPRLLAAEVNDINDLPFRADSFLSAINSSSSFHVAKTSESSTLSSFQVADDSASLDNSIGRSQTANSLNTSTDSSSTKPSSRRVSTVSLDSSGSIVDTNIGAGFFQHPAYIYGNDDDDDDNSTEVENNDLSDTLQFHKNPIDYEERPRLVLANPDNQSDSD